jgi:hypothetical protein
VPPGWDFRFPDRSGSGKPVDRQDVEGIGAELLD